MEKLSFSLSTEFSKRFQTIVISWGRSQMYLPFFLLVAGVRSFYLLFTRQVNHVHLGDALLAPLGVICKKLFGVKVTVTVAGLDITYPFFLYQRVIPHSVAYLDKVICISTRTRDECLKRGIPRNKCVVIPIGVYQNEFNIVASKDDLEKIIHKQITNEKILLTVGRLVKRKGVLWFVENVVPHLGKKYLYIVAGDGPDRAIIQEKIRTLELSHQVILLGKVSDRSLKILYNTAHLFVMPNIEVPENIEGFGIVAIEAGAAGIPTLATSIDSLTDVIVPHKTGQLIEALNPNQMIQAIKTVDIKKPGIRTYIKSHFSWPKIMNQYEQAFN